MRYWPLTAVLLAFWLGRETGAGTEEELADIQGRSLTLRHKQGHIWFSATPTPTGGQVSVRSSDASNGVQIIVDEGKTVIAVSRGQKFPQVVLGLDANGQPQLLFTRKDGTTCLAAGEHPNGHGVVLAFDKREQLAGKVPADAAWPIKQGGDDAKRPEREVKDAK